MKKTKTSESVKPWVRTLLILPAFFVIVGLFQLAGLLSLGLDLTSFKIEKTAVQETIEAIFTLAGTIVTVGIFRRFIDQESFRSMGFFNTGFGKDTLLGLGLGALLIASGFTILINIHEIGWSKTNLDI